MKTDIVMSKTDILLQLEIINVQLNNITDRVIEINKTEQFDYCTDNKLDHEIYLLKNSANRLSKIVYQE